MQIIVGIIFKIAVILFSAILHEVAHGAVALRLGDATAKMAGRLTLNPLRHLDPFGSIILPLMLTLFGGPPFGYAKPVPYNPYNFKDSRKGSLIVGLAGPLTNFVLAALFAVAIRVMVLSDMQDFGGGSLIVAFVAIMFINIILGIFNLIPIPPLDGSKALFYFFPRLEPMFARFGPVLFFLLIFWIAPNIVGPLAALSLNLAFDQATYEAVIPLIEQYRYLLF